MCEIEVFESADNIVYEQLFKKGDNRILARSP